MKYQKMLRAAAPILGGLLFALIALLSINYQAAAVQAAIQAAPAHSAAASQRQVNLLFFGLTQTLAGPVIQEDGFTSGDCFANVNGMVGGPQTTTVAIASSADGGNFAANVTMAPILTNSTSFTTATVHGSFMQVTLSMFTTTIPITGSVQCVMK